MLEIFGVMVAHVLRAMLIVSAIILYVLFEIEKYKEDNHAQHLSEGLPQARKAHLSHDGLSDVEESR